MPNGIKFLCVCGAEMKPDKDNYMMEWAILIKLTCVKCQKQKDVMIKAVYLNRWR